jgi:hypothetical protein
VHVEDTVEIINSISTFQVETFIGIQGIPSRIDGEEDGKFSTGIEKVYYIRCE